MNKCRRSWVLAFLLASTLPVLGDSPFELAHVTLYNPVDEFAARSPAASVLGAYMQEIEDKAATLWQDKPKGQGQDGLIAVAIRPERTMKLWIDVGGRYQPDLTLALTKQFEGTGIPPVKDGPIAFAIHFTLWGGSGREPEEEGQVRLPELWQKAAAQREGEPMKIPDDLLPLVWERESAKPGARGKPEMVVPDEFVVQELRPTGGRIPRPKEWFYSEGHREHVLTWTISKENADGGFYETGVRVQCFLDVRECAGMTPQEFVQAFFDQKRGVVKVLGERPEQKQDLFTRVGLETQETLNHQGRLTTYRILYSAFWANDADLAVVSIAGTPAELWETYRATFDTMSRFELSGMAKTQDAAPKTRPPPALEEPPN